MTTKMCSKCQIEKRQLEYYKSYSPLDTDERLRVCKPCLRDMVDLNDIQSVYDMLRMVDKPFFHHLWKSANNKPTVIGEYFKLINAKDYRHMTWNDSVFEDERKTQSNELAQETANIDTDYLDELKELYGFGYPDEEYILYEKRFKRLRTSFQLPTPMHEEYLREYCVNKVKESLAKARGDYKEAKEWASMAKDSADAGKLKPSQMSKSDLSQGLDGFSQLSRMVEEYKDIIPMLPKFIKQPKDDVDVTLWLYINYIRDLKSLPPATYEEIYDFYNVRAEGYENNKLDLELENVVPEKEDD